MTTTFRASDYNFIKNTRSQGVQKLNPADKLSIKNQCSATRKKFSSNTRGATWLPDNIGANPWKSPFGSSINYIRNAFVTNLPSQSAHKLPLNQPNYIILYCFWPNSKTHNFLYSILHTKYHQYRKKKKHTKPHTDKASYLTYTPGNFHFRTCHLK